VLLQEAWHNLSDEVVVFGSRVDYGNFLHGCALCMHGLGFIREIYYMGVHCVCMG
jgi:hypothetical protein